MKVKLYDCFSHWYDNGTIWLYSDPHFNDEETKQMDHNWPDPEEIVKNINSKIGKNDTLIILGDIGDESFVRKLKGYKVLITGNHDKGVSNYQRKIENVKFSFMLTQEEQEGRKKIINGYPLEGPGDWYTMGDLQREYTDKIARERVKEFTKDWVDAHRIITDGRGNIHYSYDNKSSVWELYIEKDNQLFDEVYDGPLFISDKILLSHEPIELPFGINIHGHCHSRENSISRASTYARINIASDVVSFMPQRLDSLIEKFKTKTLHRITVDCAGKKECPIKDLNKHFCKHRSEETSE